MNRNGSTGGQSAGRVECSNRAKRRRGSRSERCREATETHRLHLAMMGFAALYPSYVTVDSTALRFEPTSRP